MNIAVWVIILVAGLGALILAVKFFRWLLATGTEQAHVNTAERSRILKMVEDGKIRSEEGAELLDAMGRSNALRLRKEITSAQAQFLPIHGIWQMRRL